MNGDITLEACRHWRGAF